MYSVNGNPKGDWNFFSKNFFNHIGSATSFTLKKVAEKFSEVTDWIQSVGLSDFARYGQDGVEEKQLNFPFSLRFVQHYTVKHMFSPDYPGDPMAYVSQLETIPNGSTLYDVFAMDKPVSLGGRE